MPRSSALSRYQRDRQLRQKPARFIRSRFCTSVRSRKCATSLRKAPASSSVRVLASISMTVSFDLLSMGSRRSDCHIEAGRRKDRLQDARQKLGPLLGPRGAGNQVLAQLDRDMGQAALPGMMALGVADRLARRIGLVVA